VTDQTAGDQTGAEPAAQTFWAVIPAGGAGTRLWPMSRADRPKFLLPLHGSRSLLQQTADRLTSLAPPERTLVVCGPGHANCHPCPIAMSSSNHRPRDRGRPSASPPP